MTSSFLKGLVTDYGKLGYQLWHRPLKMASLVYEREIGVAAIAAIFLGVTWLVRWPIGQRKLLNKNRTSWIKFWRRTQKLGILLNKKQCWIYYHLLNKIKIIELKIRFTEQKYESLNFKMSFTEQKYNTLNIKWRLLNKIVNHWIKNEFTEQKIWHIEYKWRLLNTNMNCWI